MLTNCRGGLIAAMTGRSPQTALLQSARRTSGGLVRIDRSPGRTGLTPSRCAAIVWMSLGVLDHAGAAPIRWRFEILVLLIRAVL